MATETRARAAGTGDVVSSATWGIVGLNLAWITGVIGSFAEEGRNLQELLYSFAAMGGTSGAAVLVARHVRAGRELAAGGFALMTAIGVGQVLAGFGGGAADGIFVQLAVVYLPALLLIAAQDWGPMWARGAAAASGLAFAFYGYTRTLGDKAPDSDNVAVLVAYLFLTIAIIGWSMVLRSETD
jgi:hypothetical protein